LKLNAAPFFFALQESYTLVEPVRTVFAYRLETGLDTSGYDFEWSVDQGDGPELLASNRDPITVEVGLIPLLRLS
jgi:hypothetical protein